VLVALQVGYCIIWYRITWYLVDLILHFLVSSITASAALQYLGAHHWSWLEQAK
jgi:hypothetical protein